MKNIYKIIKKSKNLFKAPVFDVKKYLIKNVIITSYLLIF